MKTILSCLCIYFLCVIDANLCAQNPADCVGAQAVCNNPNFTFSATPNNGNVNELPGTNSVSNPAVNPASGNFGCLLVGENNPQWLLLNISTSGMLEFSFGAAGSPNPQVGLYDWAMWPYNANTCNDIIGNTLAPVRCNWNAVSIGGTGVGNPPPGGNAGNYEPPLPVLAGQQYIICISNFSGVNTLVTFTSTGTAQIGCSNVFANNATVCPTQAALITPSVLSIPNPVYTVQPGNIISAGPALNVSATATQVFTIQAASAGTSSNLATNTFTLFVTNTQSMAVAGPLFFCQGNNALLNAPAGLLSYTLHHPLGATNIQSGNSFSLGTATPSLNGTYTVLASQANGCISIGTTSLTVFTPPLPVISGNSLVCQNGTLHLVASNQNIVTAQWLTPTGGGVPNGTIYIPAFQQVHTGTYTLSLNHSLGPIVCPSSQTVTVGLIAMSPLVVNASQTVCTGSPIQLGATANGASAYQWAGPSGFQSTQQHPFIPLASQHHAGLYVVQAVFLQQGVQCVSQASSYVTVEQGDRWSVPTRASFCAHSSVLLEGPVGATSYSWNGPATPLVQQKDLHIATAGLQHSGVYTLQLLSAYQCRFIQTVTVSILPPLELVKAPENKIICHRNQAYNRIELRGGSGLYTYHYKPMDGITHYGGNELYLSPDKSITYTVLVKDPACPTSEINEKFTIDVIPSPQVVVTSNVTEGCEPLPVNLTSSPGGADYQTRWFIGPVQAGTSSSLLQVFKKAGNYSLEVLVTDKHGCSTRHQPNFTIRVHPQPKPFFTYLPEKITSLSGSVSFDAHSRAGQIKNVLWHLPENGDTSSAKQVSHRFHQTGWHQMVLILENEFGCVDTCIGNIHVDEELTVYVPNAFSPNNDGLNDVIKPIGEGLSSEGYEFSIFDRWGALIFVSDRPDQGWDGTYRGMPAQTDSYVYLLRFRAANSIKQLERSGHFTLLR